MSKLAQERERQRYSQKELAEKARVSQKVVSLIETGKRENASIQTYIRLANALNCKIDDIV